MDRTKRFPHLTALPTPLLGLLALAVGVLLGLVIAAPALSSASPFVLPLSAAALLVVVSLYRPLAGLLLWLLLAPYSRHFNLDLSLGAGVPDLSLTRMMAGFLLLLVLAQAALRRRRLRPFVWSDLAYVLFLGSLLLSAPQSYLGASPALQSILDAYLVPFIALFLARQLVRNLGDLRWYTAVLLVTGVALSFLIVREQLTGEVLFYHRSATAYSQSFRKVLSLMGNAAPMGVTTVMTLPLGLVALSQAFHATPATSRTGSLTRLTLALACAFIALGVYMTYNRASWLGLFLTIVVLIVLRPSSRRLLLPVLVIGILLTLIFWQGVINSAAVTERLLEGESLDYRSKVASLALDMVRRSPLFGLGYYNFGLIARQNYGWDPAPLFGIYPPAHNSYMFVLVSAGIVGLIAYVSWALLLGLEGARRYLRWGRQRMDELGDRARDVLAAGAALWLIYFLASATFDNAEAFSMNLVFYMTMGAIWGATYHGQRNDLG